MGNSSSCIGTLRSGEHFYLFDMKPGGMELGPLVVLHETTYEERHDLVVEHGDSRAMFDSPEQYATLSEDELRAHARHVAAGLLASSDMIERGLVIAHSGMYSVAAA